MKHLVPIICAVLGVHIQLFACSVPVFRYALERWGADGYTIVVIHDKDLSDMEQKAVDYLQENSWNGGGSANLNVVLADVRNEKDAPVLDHLPEKHPPCPAMFLFYPRSMGNPKIFWHGPLTAANAKLVVTSRLRREISDEIVRGRTAIWVLLESGETERDNKAYNLIKNSLLEIQEQMELPPGVATPDGSVTGSPEDEQVDPINQLESGIPLQISFSTLRFSRNESEEDIFIAMLMNLEDDLHEYRDQPMAFVVFGRGRVMQPFIGAGINENNIIDATYYLCGPCSCQVKYQNPGVDLLFNEDWDSWLMYGEVVEDRELPPLSGIADIIGEKQNKIINEEGKIMDATADAPLRRNMITGIVLIILLIAGGTAVMLKNKK